MSSRLRTRLRAGTGLSTPSLNLEFQTATGTLDPRITFSRTSQATLVDSTGKLTYAPNNLLTNSETFEAAAWNKANASVSANASVAPDGTTTADVMTSSAAAGYIYPATNLFSAAGGGSFIASVYAKAGTATSFQILLAGVANYTGTFNLSTGVATTSTGNTTVSMSAVGNGWYRCVMVCTAVASIGYAELQIGRIASTLTLNLWGAQLEQVTYQTTPGTYNSTSPKNLLGYTQEFDNAAWTKSNAFVQTNLLTYSQDFSNAAWAVSDTTATSNVSTAPDGSATADRVAETATTAFHAVVQTLATVSAANHVLSIYLKKGSGATAPDWVQLTFGGASTSYANFNLSTGVVGVVSGLTANISSVGSGWYRCSVIVAIPTAGALSVQVAFTNNTDSATRRPSYAGATTSDVLVWGAQLVQGSTAGDYQRTDAAAAAVQYVAPDGSRTADKLVEDTATNTHRVASALITMGSGATTTVSAYIKAGERTWAFITDAGVTNSGAYVNLATGQFGTINGGVTRSSIVDAGNGWYRVSVSGVLAGTLSQIQVVAATSNGTINYTGDGTSGIYIWGAQLSNSASLDPYVYNPVAAPTSAAYYGPRFDYDPVTLANKGLLIEEQRTNLLTYSADLSNAAWPKTNVTVTSAATVSPDGTVNAQRIAATASAGTVINNSATAVAATSATFTVYVKQGTGATVGNYFGIRNNTTATTLLLATVNLSTGAVVSYINGTTGISLQNAGNGWWRVTATVTSGVTSGDALLCYVGFAGQAATAGDFLYAYGAQLEAGSFATSYIPTVASQVTRTADVALMQGANFSNWYNQNEGAIYAEFDQYSITSPNNQWAVFSSDGTANNYLGSMTNPSSYRGLVVVGGSTQASIINGTVSANTLIKSMLAYKANDFAATSNGLAVGTDTSGSVPVVNSLTLGSGGGSAYLNGHIRRIGYYPTRLANEQLQSLTAQSTIPSLSLDFTTQVFNVG